MNHAQLVALGRALRVAGEHEERLISGEAVLNMEEIRRDLERAVALLVVTFSMP